MRVLVVCTGNSARSLLAEALLRSMGAGRVEVWSAGTEPKGVHPMTLATLAEAGVPADGLRSKPVTELLGRSFDVVITVCDRARDACPTFPGVARRLHWDLPDPAAVDGPEAQAAAFRSVLAELRGRIGTFLVDAEPTAPAAAAPR